MIIFYPRDIGLWREQFSFEPTLVTNPYKSRTKNFHNRSEFIDFLKENRINLTDSRYPLEFIGPKIHPAYGVVYDVIQWTLIGWIKDELI